MCKKAKHPDFKYLINLKERIYKINRQALGKQLDFPVEVINWRLTTTKADDSVNESKLLTYYDLSIDFFVCIIDSLQLLINGSTANALVLMRISLETLGLMHYAILFNKFPEVRRKYILGESVGTLGIKNSQDALNKIKKYQKEVLGIDNPAGTRIWSDLSNLVSHASTHRANNNWVSLNGQKLTTLGFRIYVNERLPSKTINLLNQLCAYYVDMTINFYDKNGLQEAIELRALRAKFQNRLY